MTEKRIADDQWIKHTKMRRIARKGWKTVRLCNVTEEKVGVKLKFQVADVHKQFTAVRSLVQKGNRMVFGPGPEENYIQNVKSGKKVHMRMKNSGSYMLDIDMKGKSGKAGVGRVRGQRC